MARYYQSDEWYQSYYYADDYNDNDGNDEGEHRGSGDAEREQEAYLLLGSISARSITFVSVYTMMLATGLSLYGSTAIVGFTSLRGIYIAPCFSSGSDNMRVGIFGGAVVIFANLLLVCAVILGEVRVSEAKQSIVPMDVMFLSIYVYIYIHTHTHISLMQALISNLLSKLFYIRIVPTCRWKTTKKKIIIETTWTTWNPTEWSE